MNMLALDSTACTASVCITAGETLVAEFTVNTQNTHSETLLPMVEAALSAAGMTIDDVDAFACSAGPGSFTGVRIGTATVKGLAFGRNKPCIGVSALEALAYNLTAVSGIVCPVMNARRAQVYTALFRAEDGVLTRLGEDDAIPLTALEEALSKYDLPVYFTGDGYDLTESITHPNKKETPERLRYATAYGVAKAALRVLAEAPDGTFTDAALAPTYLRLPQAERERLERLAKENA